MRLQTVRKYGLPAAPGVYLFKSGKRVLYVGKAASIRDRVRSYFAVKLEVARGPWVARMVAKADRIAFRRTDSVLEALLLEALLIKRYEPPYNTEGKDGKSFNCVVITDEDFPRVLILRQKDLEAGSSAKRLKLNAVFGPFPHATELRLALKIIRKIFPFRDTCVPLPILSKSASDSRGSALGRPCFNRQIGLCPGVCTGEISKREYGHTMKWIQLFFQGRKRNVVKRLQREMNRLAELEKFERAGEIKRKIFALNHINDVALFKRMPMFAQSAAKGSGRLGLRIEAFDVSHTFGTAPVGVMTVVENGAVAKKEYRTFHIKSAKGGNDAGALEEILMRRLRHAEWRPPDLIAVDGGEQQLRAALSVTRASSLPFSRVPIVSVVKNERHKPREILGEGTMAKEHESEILLANAEAHRVALAFHRRKRRRRFLG